MSHAAPFTLAVLFALSFSSPAGAVAPESLASICEAHAGLDVDGDGIAEVERLSLVAREDSEDEAANTPLLLVLVEERLLAPLSSKTGDAGAADIMASLRTFLDDLRVDGFRPRLVRAAVYAGERHQDGLTLLGLRRFLQAVRAWDSSLAGAVLVGSFPDAYLVRSYNWRLHRPVTLRKGTPAEKRYGKVPHLRTVPEGVAQRSELVLSDLDGRWEERYIQGARRLRTVYGIYPDGIPPRGGPAADTQIGGVVFEDFFFVDDGRLDVREVLGPGPDGQGEQVVGYELEPLDAYEDAECAPADLERPNPMARPDICVSRIDARRVALRPRRDVRGVDGRGLLDEEGRPQAVRFTSKQAVPKWRSIWERDPALERRLLVEYFARNHAFRAGAFPEEAFRPTAIARDLGNGWKQVRNGHARWNGLSQPERYRGQKATLIDLVAWLKEPAVLRDLRGHSDPWGTTFGRTDLTALLGEAGGTPWSWTRKGDRLVPSLEAACKGGKADFAIYRTLWENRVLPETGSIYMHTGCDSISPGGAKRRSYTHPGYGSWQGAEALMFYTGALAVVGRAKVFYDAPRGFYPALAEGRTVGEAWARYFELESAATNRKQVGGGIGRKRAYFWSVLGDWTLRLRPPTTPEADKPRGAPARERRWF
jgi:hypothetical protein